MNRLADETSPYLQQHKDNPVDWYPWGDEAFAKATAEDKPILLSIGYAACHWCHVMAHESFEDQEVADVMNRLFVNIKVDQAGRLTGALQGSLEFTVTEGDLPGREAVVAAAGMLAGRVDPVWGGFGQAPKFPQPDLLELLLRTGEGGPQLRLTLDAMAAGGI